MQKKASQDVRALIHVADPVGAGVPLDIAWLTGIIPLGFVPGEIVISPDETTLYVAHESGREVSVVDIASASVVGAVKRAGAGAITLSPDGKRLYTIGQKKCYVVDTRLREVIRIIPAANVNRILCSPDGRFICLSFQDAPGGLIRVIETENYTVENDFDLGSLSMASLALAVSPDNRRVYATTLLDRQAPTDVLAIGTLDYLQHDIPGFADLRSMVISSAGDRLYVGGIDEVYVVDATTNRMFYREKIGAQGYPVKVIGITPDNRYVYAVYTCNYDVYRIDTVKGVTTCIAYFPSVGGSVLNKAGTYIYTTHADMSWISIYKL
ncbi:YncE family protein [Pseudomonas syringae group genomosp. 3]|uniref:YncE family protein n=1 Tax=Pseudomonas syringae group genomosp. 3 TaxID=251701 RepID=UPI00070C1EAB|nr:YncE family protein [Pseudomonas syringae group genomosp. 3]